MKTNVPMFKDSLTRLTNFFAEIIKFIFITGFVLALNWSFSMAQSPQNRCWVIPIAQTAGAFQKQVVFNPNPVVSQIPNNLMNSTPTMSSYNAMQDANGRLLFYIVDGIIKDGQSNEIDVIVNPYSIVGFLQLTGLPEMCIVPVPGNCAQYYIIAAGATHFAVASINPAPMYVTLDMSLPNIYDPNLNGALVGTNVATEINQGVNYAEHAQSMHLAVTKLRAATQDRYLFIFDNTQLFRFTITANGFVNGTPIGGATCGNNGNPLKAEMELFEDNSGSYKVAVLTNGTGCYGVNVFNIPVSGAITSFHVPMLGNTGEPVGLEFSPSGQYLFATNTVSPFIQYIDLNAPTVIAEDLRVLTNIMLTPAEAASFNNSQIEMGYDGKIYFAASDRMGTLNNPNNLIGTTFSNTALDAYGNALPGIPTTDFDIRILPDQIDGEVYQNNSTSTIPCCVANTVYDVVSYVAASSSTWQPGNGNNPFVAGGIVSVQTELRIPHNVNLIIKNMTFEFAPSAKVIIEQGGSLTIDHSTFTGSACESMWQGIEVWGHSNQSQFAAGAQGKLTVKNAAMVSNALNAVTLWKPGDWSTTGGIVKATGSRFYNNKRSVEFMSYQNFNLSTGAPFANQSSFANCDFNIDDQYLGGTTNTFNAHVTMWDVWGINFNFCDFENNQTNVADAQLLGKGISAADGGFSVTGCDCRVINAPGSPCPEGDRTGSKFKGLWIGINAFNVSANRPFSVICADFENNIFGVSAYSLSNISLTNNRFAIGGNTAPWPQMHYGLNLQTCTGFTVEENSFNGSQNSPSIGAYIYNSGGHANRIYKNKFNKLTYANIAEGINRDNNSGANGLQYLCNLHTDNGQDIYVKRDDLNPGHAANGIAQSLGNTLVVPALSAGNTFTQLASGTTEHFKNETGWIVNYFYTPGTTEPMYFTPSYVNLYLTTNANTCPINFGYGTGTQLTASRKQTLETQYDVNELAY